MGEGPANIAPLGWVNALMQAQAQMVPQLFQQGLGQAAGRQFVQTTMGYGQAVPFALPRLSDEEAAEEYWEQCLGVVRSPQERALDLLLQHLTWYEREEWWITGWITVTAKSGRKYWISGTNCGRVDNGHTFCVYVGAGIPDEDRVLGLKLLIESDEAQFLKTAVDRGAQHTMMQQGENPIFAAAVGQYNGVQLWPEGGRSWWRKFMDWAKGENEYP